MKQQMTMQRMQRFIGGFREALQHPFGAELTVLDDVSGERVIVDVVRDGATAHVLRIRGGRGQRYFEGGIQGLSADWLAHIVVVAFRNSERLLPS